MKNLNETETAWIAAVLLLVWITLHEEHRRLMLAAMCQFVMDATRWAVDLEAKLRRKLDNPNECGEKPEWSNHEGV